LSSPSSQHTTIEESDDIATITFFVAKPLKKAMSVDVAFFCNKTIEKGDGSCYCLLLLLKYRKEGNITFFSATPSQKKTMVAFVVIFFFFSNIEKKATQPSSLQHHHIRKQ
jgi:hypothetical protein